MANLDPSTHQSVLSAEAETFIPNQTRGGSGGGIPRYITTCYPFVQDDPGLKQRAPVAPWRSPTGALIYRGKAQPPPPVQGPNPNFRFRGNQPNTPGNRMVRPPKQVPMPSGGQPIQQPYQPQPNHFNPYFGFPMPPGLQGWVPPVDASVPPDMSAYNFPPGYNNAGAMMNSGDWSAGDGSTDKKSRKKKFGPDGGHMVSVGIQNESGLYRGSGSCKRKNKPRTIICMDAAVETDFSDEVANLTLLEQPHPLYKNDASRSWLEKYNETTSDSEEVDSDSGYSSPLHRRNQASNGTNPYQVGGYLPPPPNSSYAAAAAGLFLPPRPGAPGYPPGFVPTSGYNMIPPPPNSMSQPAYMQGYPPLPLTLPPPPAPSQTNVRIMQVNNFESITHNNSAAPSTHSEQSYSVTNSQSNDESTGKKKRKRGKRKKRGGASSSGGDDYSGALSDEPYDMRRANSSSNVSRTSTIDNEILHFEDEDEFPNLLSAVGVIAPPTEDAKPLSYSDILKSKGSSQTQPITSPDPMSDGNKNSAKEGKNARKRRKRKEQVNKAADKELAEISIEQQMLKELSSNNSKALGAQVKKSKQPLSFNIADMISSLEQQKGGAVAKSSTPIVKTKEKTKDLAVTNLLDSSAPLKRGKEREQPKSKKPSPLKKVILKEREERKKLRLLDETNPLSPGDSTGSSQVVSVAGMPLESGDLSQDPDALSGKTSSADCGGTPLSNELSPISQTSPISMSPLSGSPLSSGVNSPIAGNLCLGTVGPGVLSKIHSRRFREYCNQILNKDIDSCCTNLLQDLVRFQDRLFHKDPTKAKSKRRLVLGLREVTKHLKLRKIKCVIISPNLERIQSKGGLDDALNTIIGMCSQQNVPFVFALGRRALGRACAKLVPVSVVGIFNFEGSESNFHQLISLTQSAREQYQEMVQGLEKEIVEYSAKMSAGAGGSSIQQLFPHMGHSRTPSACSAISFTSSILSEPISENYPYSEPETDSRGYEIIKNMSMKIGDSDIGQVPIDPSANNDKDSGEGRSDSPESSGLSNTGKMSDSLGEIDEGNEADTEDDHNNKKVSGKKDMYSSNKNTSAAYEGDSEDTVEELPYIDSIHSSVVDVTLELQSQHSSKTLDHNTDCMSTHSSKTLEGTVGGRVTPDRSSRNMGSAPDLREASGGSSGTPQTKSKTMDKERIELWVADAQKQFQSSIDRVTEEPEETQENNTKVDTADEGDDLDQEEVSSIHIKSSCDEEDSSDDEGENEEEEGNKVVKVNESNEIKESSLTEENVENKDVAKPAGNDIDSLAPMLNSSCKISDDTAIK